MPARDRFFTAPGSHGRALQAAARRQKRIALTSSPRRPCRRYGKPMRMLDALRKTFRSAVDGFNEDELFTHAAAIAYYSALSMAPLIVLTLWLLSLLRAQWQMQLNHTLTEMMGDKAAR